MIDNESILAERRAIIDCSKSVYVGVRMAFLIIILFSYIADTGLVELICCRLYLLLTTLIVGLSSTAVLVVNSANS